MGNEAKEMSPGDEPLAEGGWGVLGEGSARRNSGNEGIIADGAGRRMVILSGNGKEEDIFDFWMGEALEEARKALKEGEIPVGAVVVLGDEVLGRGHNQKEAERDPTAHAEVAALREAGKRAGSWRIEGATLYVTTEPCVMCWGAVLEARLRRVVYGGFPSPEDTSHLGPEALEKVKRRVEVVSGVRAEEASALIRKFFREQRKARKAHHLLGEVAESG